MPRWVILTHLTLVSHEFPENPTISSILREDPRKPGCIKISQVVSEIMLIESFWIIWVNWLFFESWLPEKSATTFNFREDRRIPSYIKISQVVLEILLIESFWLNWLFWSHDSHCPEHFKISKFSKKICSGAKNFSREGCDPGWPPPPEPMYDSSNVVYFPRGV